jgi:hypothetical protein
VQRIVKERPLPLHELVLFDVVNLEIDVGVRTTEGERSVLCLEHGGLSVIVAVGCGMLYHEASLLWLTRKNTLLVLVPHIISINLHLGVD